MGLTVRTPNPALVILLGGLVLVGCGYKGPVTRLVPPDPALTKDQQRAARAEERRTVERGLTVPADARPIRVDELTVRLGVRGDDPFNLPPEGTQTSRVVPFPGEEPDSGAAAIPPIPGAGATPVPAAQATPAPAPTPER
jgi:predicted small lipoprotein YifL